MPKIDLAATEQTNRTGYPDPFAAAVGGRWVRRLGPGSGLADFGISHVVLKPGAASSQRHWHEDEDEFVVMLSGQAVLVEDEGRFAMQAGDVEATEADTSALQQATGFNPDTPVEEGIRRFVEWYREYYRV